MAVSALSIRSHHLSRARQMAWRKTISFPHSPGRGRFGDVGAGRKKDRCDG